jgi:hypothetical protein
MSIIGFCELDVFVLDYHCSCIIDLFLLQFIGLGILVKILSFIVMDNHSPLGILGVIWYFRIIKKLFFIELFVFRILIGVAVVF